MRPPGFRRSFLRLGLRRFTRLRDGARGPLGPGLDDRAFLRLARRQFSLLLDALGRRLPAGAL